VVLQLFNTKCVPCLFYGLETHPLVKSELSSLDFVVNRFFMQMFRTSNIEIVRNCNCLRPYFSFNLPSELWSNRVKRFDIVKYTTCGAALWITVHVDFWCLSCSDLFFFVVLMPLASPAMWNWGTAHAPSTSNCLIFLITSVPHKLWHSTLCGCLPYPEQLYWPIAFSVFITWIS